MHQQPSEPLKSVAYQYLMDSCDTKVSVERKQEALNILYKQIDNLIPSEVANKQMDKLIGNHSVSQKIANILSTKDTPIFSAMATPQRLFQLDHHKCRNWTQYEDQRLLCAIHKFGVKNWAKIAEFVGNNRTKSQCSQRWDRGLNPQLVKGPWTPEQEKLLLDLVSKFGEKAWKKIAELIGNRSDVQCRYHYQKLTKTNITNSPIPSSDTDNSSTNPGQIMPTYLENKQLIVEKPHDQVNRYGNTPPSIIKQIYDEQFISVFDSDSDTH